MGSQLGSLKVAAKRVGVPFEEYSRLIRAGKKWCTHGKHWASIEVFPPDAHRQSGKAQGCWECLQAYQAKRSRRRNSPRRLKEQCDAHHAVSRAIAAGILPSPNTLRCIECNHRGEDRKHQYHHHHGYAPESWLDVVPICTRCHVRETRRANGLPTFTPKTRSEVQGNGVPPNTERNERVWI